MLDVVEVRFRRGINLRLFGARERAREQWYPDIPAYLRATWQVQEYCEVVPQEELERTIKAEEVRAYCLTVADGE